MFLYSFSLNTCSNVLLFMVVIFVYFLNHCTSFGPIGANYLWCNTRSKLPVSFDHFLDFLFLSLCIYSARHEWLHVLRISTFSCFASPSLFLIPKQTSRVLHTLYCIFKRHRCWIHPMSFCNGIGMKGHGSCNHLCPLLDTISSSPLPGPFFIAYSSAVVDNHI